MPKTMAQAPVLSSTARKASTVAVTDDGEFLEALDRGLAVLTLFDASRTEMTLSEVALRMDLPKATARRLLYTLTHLGYLSVDERKFRLTPNVLRLANAFLVANSSAEIFKPVCESVCEQVGEPVSVAILDGADIVMLALALPAREIFRGPSLGLRLPAFCTSIGRVLLSAMPDKELDRFLSELKPTTFTEFTITDKKALRAAIRQVRVDGYALVDQEQGYGYRSIAVPLRRFDGAAVAALQIGVTAERASPETMRDKFLPVLKVGADELSELLL